jgi:hypothetical protein
LNDDLGEFFKTAFARIYKISVHNLNLELHSFYWAIGGVKKCTKNSFIFPVAIGIAISSERGNWLIKIGQ